MIGASITYAAALLFPSLGEDMTESSGIYNIGTEGIMLISVAVTFVGTVYTGNPFVGLGAGISAGAIIGLVLAFFAINIKADQVIFGLGIILLGSFLGIFLVGVTEGIVKTIQVPLLPTLNTSAIPYPLNVLFKQNTLVYVALVLSVVMWLLLFKTKFGLAVRTVGENPHVAASAGINVVLIRYVCAVVGCAIAAIGGAFVLLGISGIWSENMTAGRGFVAIAVVRIGFFRPLFILLFSLIFGLVDSLQLSLQVTTAGFPAQFLQMLPYIVGIIALIVSGKFKLFGEPASVGKPYTREQR